MTDQNRASSPSLYLDLHCAPAFCRATVIVPASIVDNIYHYIAAEQKENIETQGFGKGRVPISYIKQNFHSSLTEHLKQFLLNYMVINFLYEEIHARKILAADQPTLTGVAIEPGSDARFLFDLSLFPEIAMREWKYFPFTPPKRKNYKDLDRQVESFVKDEREQLKENAPTSVHIGDWVRFALSLITNQGKPLISHQEILWLKMGDEEVDTPLRSIFIGKTIGHLFSITSTDLQCFFSQELNASYHFHIKILDIIHESYFCFEQFKKHFKIKTNKEMHQKLIEVFSYRNSMSQRRSTAEESLKLLLNKQRFTIPSHLVLRKQEYILHAIRSNPDYHVYRVQKDFKERIRQLAEKQLKEKIVLDHIAYADNMHVSEQDVRSYLNLLNRPRMKEFIYFDPPITKLSGQEMPIAEAELKQICLREKTLNHIIFHLTKK